VKKKVLSDLLVFGGIFADPLRVEHLRIIVHLIEQALSEVGNDGGKKNKPPYATLSWDKREKQTAGRVRHDNRVAAVCRYCLRYDVGISCGICLRFVGGQIHSHRVVTALLQLGNEQIPAGSVLR
jgi:hypothetical protein